MSRRSLCAAVPVVLWIFIAASGCGAPSTWSFPSLFRRDATADNPLRQQLAEQQAASARVEVPTKASEVGSKLPPETQALVAKELQDATPSERAQLEADLAGLDPPMVRQILRIRRMVRQVGQNQDVQTAATEPGHSHFRQSEPPVRLTSGYGPAVPAPEPDGSRDPYTQVPGRDPATDPGLGVDPWNRPRPTAPAVPEGVVELPPAPHHELPLIRPGKSERRNPVELSAEPFSSDPTNAEPADNRLPVRRPNLPLEAEMVTGPGSEAFPPASSEPPLPQVSAGPYAQQDGRLPGEPFGSKRRVPNYTQSNGDPFAERPLLQSASRNPDQRLNGTLPGTGSDTTADWSGDLLRVITRLEASLDGMRYADQDGPEAQNAYIQRHVFLRMLYLMAGREERALTAIPDIPPAEREFWQQVFWATSNYFDVDTMPDADYRATQTAAQLRSAVQRLQEQARLELRNVAFCQRIASFGSYEPFEPYEFRPGQPVLLYAEVANFKSTLTPKNEYTTELKSTVEISRVGGEVVERMTFPATKDFCRNYRRDYFHSYEFTIPQRIALGPHVLTLTVEDQLSGKVATYQLNFTVK